MKVSSAAYDVLNERSSGCAQGNLRYPGRWGLLATAGQFGQPKARAGCWLTNFHTVILPDTNAGVGGAQVDTAEWQAVKFCFFWPKLSGLGSEAHPMAPWNLERWH